MKPCCAAPAVSKPGTTTRRASEGTGPTTRRLCRSSAAADEAKTGRRRCRNEHVTRPGTEHLDEDLVVAHVVPRMYDAHTQDELSVTWTHDVRMLLSGYEYPPCRLPPLKEGERALLYHDVQRDNPLENYDDRRFTEKLLVLLSPIEAESFTPVPPPPGLVRASDLRDNEGFTKDEQVAMHLNAFNVRCYVQKERQVKHHAFVLLVEFDVREGTDETTLSLVVTTLADGLDDLGSAAPTTTRRRFLFRAPRSSPRMPDFVADAFSRSPWAPVRGMVPLGIDYVLARPDYAAAIRAAREAGRTPYLHLYCRSPVLAGAGESHSSDEYCTRMVYWMQTLMHRGYDVGVEISRLPDGITGDEVEDPADVLGIMRRLEEEGRFVDQPLLTVEDRCVPEETHGPEAFVVSVADTLVQPDVDWDRVWSMESGDKRGLRARVKYLGEFP